jgi:hypothetical protein
MSSDGSSWLNAYASLTATEPIASHMQSVAFAEGETVTYLRGERDWIVVSGTKAYVSNYIEFSAWIGIELPL